MINNDHSSSAMMISDTLKSIEIKDEKLIDCKIIKQFLKILSVLLLIFTIIFFSLLGCFLVLNDSTNWAAQTVTLSSEGPMNETYPHSLGKYHLTVHNWYRHMDRQNRFLVYNNLGNIKHKH